jgi:hypothetical protein
MMAQYFENLDYRVDFKGNIPSCCLILLIPESRYLPR